MTSSISPSLVVCASGTPPSYAVHGFQGYLVDLQPLTPSALPILYEWSTDITSMMLWGNRRDIPAYEQFVGDTERRLYQHTLTQMMIYAQHTQEPVGTIYAYDASIGDGYTFVTIYMVPSYRRKRYGLDAMVVFIDYLWAYFPLRKIYAEVYGYNAHSLSVMRQAGLQEEGCFRNHRYHNGDYTDLYRFALYRSDWSAIRAAGMSYIESPT